MEGGPRPPTLVSWSCHQDHDEGHNPWVSSPVHITPVGLTGDPPARVSMTAREPGVRVGAEQVLPSLHTGDSHLSSCSDTYGAAGQRVRLLGGPPRWARSREGLGIAGQVGDTVKTGWVMGQDAGRTQAGLAAAGPSALPGCQGGPGAWRWELRQGLCPSAGGAAWTPLSGTGRAPGTAALPADIPACPRPFLPQLLATDSLPPHRPLHFCKTSSRPTPLSLPALIPPHDPCHSLPSPSPLRPAEPPLPGSHRGFLRVCAQLESQLP